MKASSLSGGGATAALVLAALVAGILVAQFLPTDLFGLRGDSRPANESQTESTSDAGEQELWTCGMHPHVLEEEPGSCPICGMDLTPVTGSSGDDPAADATPTWTCPDHDMIVEDAPGQCPIDGLDLVPVDAPEASSRPAIDVDAGTLQKMNVRTTTAERRDLRRPIRTVGYLEYDQQRMVTVTTKYSGWIEKVFVNYVGEKVRAGQPLFEIYSPELVQTEKELLSALRFAREMQDAPEDAQRRAWSLVESARLRLGYWDISAEEIRSLEETGEVFRTLEVRAPAGGLVMKRLAGLEGMAVRPGMELFHIADLSHLWVEAELFEDQVAWVHEGMEAKIELSYFPGETISGRVRILEPALSEGTRTMRVKIAVPNRGKRLRKGMYATVTLEPIVSRGTLTVPIEAVLRTGTRDVVVVSEGGGRFVPREVEIGLEAGGFADYQGTFTTLVSDELLAELSESSSYFQLKVVVQIATVRLTLFSILERTAQGDVVPILRSLGTA